MSESHFSFSEDFHHVLGSWIFGVVPQFFNDVALGLWEAFSAIDTFQWQILRVFFLIFCINCILIWIAWEKFGEKISERFMKPISSKTLEALKREANALKLPEEHTPRI